MPQPEQLLIVGASARAAAFSAVRAGLRPWCIDLFADADLCAVCSCRRETAHDFSGGIIAITEYGPPGPWLYTGAIENRPQLVRQLSEQRLLWGNNIEVLQRVRSPHFLRRLCRRAGIPFPDIRFQKEKVPADGTWLVKPRRSGGGTGIGFWNGSNLNTAKPVYFQRFVDGESCSATYLGVATGARLLGVTWQLVGEPWLHAAPFHYCGSIGPMPLDDRKRQTFVELGNVLAAGCGLRGLFGVDCLLQDGTVWPAEVNPRYTASVEVLERATGLKSLALHRAVFEPKSPAVGGARYWEAEAPAEPRKQARQEPRPPKSRHYAAVARDPGGLPKSACVGKAILFAPQPLVFPSDGPWLEALCHPFSPESPPAFGDIPTAGELIPRGRPVLSLFATASSTAACRNELQRLAAALDRWLLKR